MNKLFSDEKVNIILMELRKQIIENESFRNELKKDYNNFDTKINFNELIKTVNSEKYMNKQYLPKIIKNCIISEIGNIGVIYNGNPIISLKMLIIAIRTHNNIVFITENYKNFNNKLIEIINQILQRNDYYQKIKIDSDYNQYTSYEKFVFIGRRQEYENLNVILKSKTLFYDFEEMNVVLDDKINNENRRKLKSIDEYAFNNDIYINYITLDKKNIEEQINYINSYGNRQSIAIFTGNINNVYYLINQVKAKNIYINQNPFINSELIEFDEADFIIYKNIIV